MTSLADIRYHRANSLCNAALHILCCGKGDIRSRLSLIDKEFFCLKPKEFPDIAGLRREFELLTTSVRKLQPISNESSIDATISKSRLTTLESIAKRIWDIHYLLNNYIRCSNENSAKVLHGDAEVSTAQDGHLPFIDT